MIKTKVCASRQLILDWGAKMEGRIRQTNARTGGEPEGWWREGAASGELR